MVYRCKTLLVAGLASCVYVGFCACSTAQPPIATVAHVEFQKFTSNLQFVPQQWPAAISP